MIPAIRSAQGRAPIAAPPPVARTEAFEPEPPADKPPFELRLVADAFHRVIHLMDGGLAAGAVDEQRLSARGGVDADDPDRFGPAREQPGRVNSSNHGHRRLLSHFFGRAASTAVTHQWLRLRDVPCRQDLGTPAIRDTVLTWPWQ